MDKIKLKALIPNSIPCSNFTDKSLGSYVLLKFSNSAWKSFEKERLIFSISNLAFLIKLCCVMLSISLLSSLGLLIKEAK
ncbi:hypothetical protein HpHA33_15280 [Helicobacter pylori]